MKREQNKIHQKLDGLKAPMNKEAFWERMQQLEDFPKKEAAKDRRGWWYGLFVVLLLGLGGLAWIIVKSPESHQQVEQGLQYGVLAPEVVEPSESLETVEQSVLSGSPDTKAMEAPTTPDKAKTTPRTAVANEFISANITAVNTPTTAGPATTEQQAQRITDAEPTTPSSLQPSPPNPKDTLDKSSLVSDQAPNLNPVSLQESDNQNTTPRLKSIPVPSKQQDVNTSSVHPADSTVKIKAPRANHLPQNQEVPPAIKPSTSNSSLAIQQPPAQQQALEGVSAPVPPAEQNSIALSQQLDNSNIPLLDHQRRLPEHLRHLKLIPKVKNYRWGIALSAGVGYTRHQLSIDSIPEIDDFNYRTANSSTLESYVVDLELSRQILSKWTLALSLQYRQDHQRFQASYIDNEVYTPNNDPSNGFFSKTADRITHEHFHRYRTLQWGLSLGRTTNVGKFQLEYMAGLGTQLFFSASGQLLDASNTLISLNENNSYENNWQPFYFGQVRLARPIGHRLALIGDLRLQSTLRWTRKETAVRHRATPMVAKVGIRYSF